MESMGRASWGRWLIRILGREEQEGVPGRGNFTVTGKEGGGSGDD